MSPRIIQEVRISPCPEDRSRSILIDGEPCPFYISDEAGGIRVEADPDTGMSRVYLPVLADRVVIEINSEAAS